METINEKNIGTLIHIYDHLNDGYFSAHHQLQYYNEKAYNLYLNKDNDGLLSLYNELKNTIPDSILTIIENSPGIRYFCCDGCHDAKIKDAYIDEDYLSIILDSDGMLGCLNVDKIFEVKIKTNSKTTCQELLDDIKIFKGMYWLYSDITFNNSVIDFELELQAFSDTSYINIKYKFIISDIVIKQKK